MELAAGSKGALLDVGEVAEARRRLAGRHGVLAKGWGFGAESRSVRSRLATELGEVKIGASAVSHIHGLGEAALSVVAVKDNAVEGDADNLNYDLDDDADHCPVLQATDELVVNLVTVDGSSVVFHASPSPHVGIVRIVLGVLEESCGDGPENHA